MVSLVPQQSTLGETHRLLPGSEDEHWHRIAGVAVDNILLKARMQQHSLTSLEAPPPIAAPACSPPSVQSTGLASNGHFLSPNLSSVGADGQPSAPPAPFALREARLTIGASGTASATCGGKGACEGSS